MRRADREIRDFGEIVGVLQKCDTLHVGFNGEDFPYVVPVSFGFDAAEGRVTLYFHGAGKGWKHELAARDPRVCVEVSLCGGFRESEGGPTCAYESVIGFGRVRRLSGEAVRHALGRINAHCGFPDYAMGDCVAATTVYAVDVESLTGKRHD